MGLLEGVRVLDFTIYQQVPQAQGELASVTGEPEGYPLPAGAAVADYVGDPLAFHRDAGRGRRCRA